MTCSTLEVSALLLLLKQPNAFHRFLPMLVPTCRDGCLSLCGDDSDKEMKHV